MTHRFFIPSNCLTPPIVRLPGEAAHQIKTVLRLQPGAEIIVLDNSGQEWRVRLTSFGKNEVAGEIIAHQPAQGEPAVQVNLYQGTLKGQKFEWVLQKGAELGVSRFTPVICQRSVVNKRQEVMEKYPRWQRIIQEAAEQSRRGRLPELTAVLTLTEAIQQTIPAKSSDSLALMPWEEASGPSLKTILAEAKPSQISIFIGPEGGFTPEEAAAAQAIGVRLVKLGPRILRAETAGLAVCSAILYELGEWGFGQG
ncbi:MAG: 16S rRNA (uracil(1498)-N(3))-methyltransferase [Anaerolineae bacterium]